MQLDHYLGTDRGLFGPMTYEDAQSYRDYLNLGKLSNRAQISSAGVLKNDPSLKTAQPTESLRKSYGL